MRITPIKVHGRRRWRLDYRIGTRRFQPTFKTKAEATTEMETLTEQKAASGQAWMAMSAQERNEIILVLAEIKKAGQSLRDVWELAKASAKFPRITSRPLDLATEDFLKAKRAAGRAPHYIKCLGSTLRLFAAGRQATPVHQCTLGAITEWLAGRTPYDQATKLRHLSAFFEYAKRQSWTEENPVRRAERVCVPAKPPQVLTIRQCALALAYTQCREPRFLAWLALSLFAGLRPEEARQIAWPAIDTKRGVVVIDSTKTKVRKRRVIELHPTAKAWLLRATKLEAVLPLGRMNHRRFLHRLRARLGFAKWPQDVLRHTAASHLLNLHQDAQRVALTLGNSPDVLMRHYRELVYPDHTARFWRLKPKA